MNDLNESGATRPMTRPSAATLCPGPRRLAKPPRASLKSLRVRAEKLMGQTIGYISHPSFPRLKLSSVELPKGPSTREEPRSEGSEWTSLSALFQAPLLRPEFETALFRRMNYLKYRADRLRAQIDPDSPQRRLLEEVEGLLAEAERCRALLAESNLRLVAAVARKFAGSVVDFEDLLSEGNMVLVHVIDKFDFSRGFRFSTYAVTAIQRHFYRVIARRQRQRLQERSASEVVFEEVISREEAVELPSVPRETIDAWIGRLDPRFRSILVDRYDLEGRGEVRTFRSIAEEIGVSKESVRQLQSRALEKLRKVAEEAPVAIDEWETVGLPSR